MWTHLPLGIKFAHVGKIPLLLGRGKYLPLGVNLVNMFVMVQNTYISCSFCLIVPRLFKEKRRDTVFGFPWCVACGAWCWIFSRYLVPLTLPTAFIWSFWNFTGALRMVWRYACVFFQNPEIIFYHFLHILNLDIFWVLILQKSIGSRYLVPLTPPTVFGPILLKLYMGF